MVAEGIGGQASGDVARCGMTNTYIMHSAGTGVRL